MELARGTMLGERLRLLEPIGSGAMGSVWLAEDLSLERRVAVKLIHKHASQRPTALGRFRREATLAGRIKSPHVVAIHAHGVTDDGVPYIVMEHLEGRPLADELARPMSPEETLAIVEQIGHALSAAHALGVVHRDIKPANVFLLKAPGYERFVKVVDFGIAKRGLEETEPAREPSATTGDNDLTATGTLLGTPRYMSPEQLVESKDADAQSDLWALAVVAYQLLTGELPFQGNSVGALTLAVTHGTFTPPSRRRPDLEPELGAALDAWFARALCPRKEGRFASAEELVAALALATRGELAAASSDPLDATVEAPIEPRTVVEETKALPSPRPRRWPYAVAALGICAAVAAVLWWATRPVPVVAHVASASSYAPSLDLATRVKRYIEAWRAAWERRDPDQLGALYAPGAELAVPGLEGWDEIRTAELVGYHEDLWKGFPDARTTAVRVVAAGDAVVVEWAVAGTNTERFLGDEPTHATIGYRGAHISWLDGAGKVTREHVYTDRITLIGQLGRAPEERRFRAAAPLPAAPAEIAVGAAPEQLALAERWVAKNQARDDPGMLDMMADEVRFAPQYFAADVEGKAALRSSLAAYHAAFTNTDYQSKGCVAAGRYFACEVAWTATWSGVFEDLPPNGRTGTLHSLEVFEVREGKIVSWTAYSNGVEFAAAFGLLR